MSDIDKWFDEAMEEAGFVEPESDDVVLSADDVAVLFGEPEPASGFVYYDERTGEIRSVSEGAQPDIDLAFIEVPAQRARDLMSGNQSLSNVMVAYHPDSEHPVLTSRAPDVIMVKPARGWSKSNDNDTAPVVVTFGIPRDHHIGTVSVESASRVVFSEDPIRVRLTPRGNPDDITCEFDLDLSPLNTSTEMPLELDFVIPWDVDVVASALYSTAIKAIPYSSENRPLPAPKGRNRMCRATSVEALRDCAGGLVVDYIGDRLVVHLHKKGGHYYDLPLESLMLSLTRPDDAEAVLWYGRVSVADLRDGKRIEFELAEPLDAFDTVSQLYWDNFYVRDLTQVEDDCATLPLPTLSPTNLVVARRLPDDAAPGLLIRLQHDSLTVTLVGDGGRRYDNPCEEFRVIVFRQSMDIPVWKGSVVLDEEAFVDGVIIDTELGQLEGLRVALDPLFEHSYFSVAHQSFNLGDDG